MIIQSLYDFHKWETMDIKNAFEAATVKLNDHGLTSRWYVVPDFDGYVSLAGQSTDVHCIEVLLGQAHGKSDYDTYAMAQCFLADYPSVALTFVIDRRRSDGEPGSDPPTLDLALDEKFSRLFLTTMNTAFNDLDPTGQKRGLLVQSYHSKIVLADFIRASSYSWELVRRFKADGQLAQVAVDYFDPLSTVIATAMRPLKFLIDPDIHMLPRTKDISTIQMPVARKDTGFYLIGGNSTALDQGFGIAKKYLDKHYLNFGLKNPKS